MSQDIKQKLVMSWRSPILLSTVILFFILLIVGPDLANKYKFQQRKIDVLGELPKLFPDVQWTSIKKEELGFLSRTGKQYYEEGYHFKSTGLKSYPNDFIIYYENELNNRGWKKINSIEGPGAKSYFYSKINGGVKLVQHYIFGNSLEERFFSFGVILPGWSNEYPNNYQVYVEHN